MNAPAIVRPLPRGPRGATGSAPAHEWSGPSLRFYNPDGTPGAYVNLQGPSGAAGVFQIFGTRANLAAASLGAGIGSALTCGYSAEGDGGDALYRRVATQPTHAGKVQSADGAWWELVANSGVIWPRQLGMKADGVADDSDAFQNAIDLGVYLKGSIVQLPGGQIVTTRSMAWTDCPLTIRGTGMAGGIDQSPGTEQVDPLGATCIVANFANGPVLHYTGTRGPCFEDFQITSSAIGVYRTTGAGIQISSADYLSNPLMAARISRVQMSYMYDGVLLEGVIFSNVEHCRFVYWANCALKSTAKSAYETATGFIEHNIFQDFSAVGNICIEIHNGYTIISENLLVGCKFGVSFQVDTRAVGRMVIKDNHIENQATVGVYCIQSGSQEASMLVITDNEFSVLGHPASFQGHISIQAGDHNWLANVTVSDNVFNSDLDAGSFYIVANAGTNLSIRHNTINNTGSNTPVGIVTGGSSAAPVFVQDNIFSGAVGANKYVLSSATVLRDSQGLTFSALTAIGALANGSLVYVTDGKATNIAVQSYVLTGSGGGCFVHRQGGLWIVGGVA